jgi:hypothetical protein
MDNAEDLQPLNLASVDQNVQKRMQDAQDAIIAAPVGDDERAKAVEASAKDVPYLMLMLRSAKDELAQYHAREEATTDALLALDSLTGIASLLQGYPDLVWSAKGHSRHVRAVLTLPKPGTIHGRLADTQKKVQPVEDSDLQEAQDIISRIRRGEEIEDDQDKIADALDRLVLEVAERRVAQPISPTDAQALLNILDRKTLRWRPMHRLAVKLRDITKGNF